MKYRFIFTAVLCGLGFLSAPAEEAQPKAGKPYQGLVDNSPFLSPAFRARLGKHDPTTLSFTGYTRIGGLWYFALIERKSGQTYWLEMEKESNGIQVESFDEAAQMIHLAVGGIGTDLVLLDAAGGSMVQRSSAPKAPKTLPPLHKVKQSTKAKAKDKPSGNKVKRKPKAATQPLNKKQQSKLQKKRK